ncbi:MAG TPA: DNA polymerase III subunit beta [Candidatus Butyricicoccus avicola]|nr:DNA polymerase III subunit beta [Candidatus Butyricicoccus avicola]
MKFSCEKTAFLDAISIASRAVSTKSTIAILEGLRITAADTLTLSGYDLSMGIRTEVEADILEPGEIVLSAKLLGDIVRKLPNDVVYVETDEKLLTTIKCGRSVFNLVASASDDFPAMPEVNAEYEIPMPENVLKSMINQTVFAVSDNQAKPIHTGCLFELTGGRLTVVAVDGFRLSIRRETLEHAPAEDMKFVVPGTALREIERILHEDGDNLAAVCPGEKHILFALGKTTLVCRLIDGEFLNYNAAIPTSFEYTVQTDTHELITCLERVSLLVSEKLKNPVRITFDGAVMKMTCITAVGKSYDECAIDGSVDNLEIGFNSRYLLDALRAASDETIHLSLKGALNPIVITPTEGDKYTYLVLPVRLKANA